MKAARMASSVIHGPSSAETVQGSPARAAAMLRKAVSLAAVVTGDRFHCSESYFTPEGTPIARLDSPPLWPMQDPLPRVGSRDSRQRVSRSSEYPGAMPSLAPGRLSV